MYIRRQHVEHLGFKGSDIWIGNWHSHWYRVFPERGTVVGIANLEPRGVYRFWLTPKEMQRFQNGKLVLTPPGSCHVSLLPNKEDWVWLYKGEIKRTAQLREILAKTGLFPEIVSKSVSTRTTELKVIKSGNGKNR